VIAWVPEPVQRSTRLGAQLGTEFRVRHVVLFERIMHQVVELFAAITIPDIVIAVDHE
jgi:hypothetical protein